MRRAVIFANGKLPYPAAIRALLRPDDWIVAADGGTRHALTCGRCPHLIIGDLDSFPPGRRANLEAHGVEFLPYPADKDETDLELALLHVASNNVTGVLIVGALGGRLDQTLANIQLLARPELRSLDVQITDGRQSARLVQSKATIHGAAGSRLSLLPLGGDARGICTSGLKWPLANETLHFGQTRGVSNVMTGPVAHIQLETGLLLCIHMTDER